MTKTAENISTEVTRHLEDLANKLDCFDLSKNNKTIPLERHTSPKLDILTKIVTSFNDMQERACSAYSENKLLSQAVDHAPLVIVIASGENLIQYVNIEAERLTGYSRSELLGKNISVFAGLAESTKEIMKEIEYEIKQGKKWEGVIESRAKSGKTLNCFSIVSPVLDSEKKLVNTIFISREIFSEADLQKELIHTGKVETIARLSSGFAHEFGNPLFGVRSVITDFCSRDNLTEDDKKLLTLANEECERMRVMLKEFRQHCQDITAGEDK